jgi:hypothetical protein
MVLDNAATVSGLYALETNGISPNHNVWALNMGRIFNKIATNVVQTATVYTRGVVESASATVNTDITVARTLTNYGLNF